jgi:putative endonuclease
MTMLSNKTGVLGETLACTYLQRKGYTILERNFQNTKGYKYGEIDIIATQEKVIVFVEVKTRLIKKGEVIIPEENISPKKLSNLEKIAATYLSIKKLRNADCRFDAIAILLNIPLKKAQVRHLENIFF